jgi:hypothetical protein
MMAGAIAVCATLFGEGAAGAKGLMIHSTASSSIAPAQVTLTASVSSDADPIVAYDWTALDVAPRCRISKCKLNVEIASCRYVELLATTSLGDTLTATRTVCVGDAAGRPTIAHLAISDPGGSAPFSIVAETAPGSDAVAVVHRWVDDQEIDGNSFTVPRDGACHAVDLLAADVHGRISLDRRRVCTSASASVLWIGATPDPFTQLGQQQKLCAEGEDPRGGMVDWTTGAVALGSCTLMASPPAAFARRTTHGRHANDPESTASIIVAAAPVSGPRALVFATVAGLPQSPLSGDPIDATARVFGGVAPFSVAVTLSPLGSDQAVDGTAGAVNSMGETAVHIDHVPEAGAHELDVVIRDARGLEAHASAKVMVGGKGGGADGGVADGGKVGPPGKVGCGGTLVIPRAAHARAPWLEAAISVLALLCLRRRR